MSQHTLKTKLLTSLVGLGLLGGAVGCETNSGSGALLGGAAGAGLGAAVGSHSHGRAGEGALIGGAIGAISGAMIGDHKDRKERERASRYYDDYDRRPSRAYYRERDYGYEDRPRRYYEREPDGYYEYRSYRSYDGYGGRSSYSESRRYYDY